MSTSLFQILISTRWVWAYETDGGLEVGVMGRWKPQMARGWSALPQLVLFVDWIACRRSNNRKLTRQWTVSIFKMQSPTW
jgi:hypothetical protein